MKIDLGVLTINPSFMNQALSSGNMVAPLALMKQGCLGDYWYVLGYT